MPKYSTNWTSLTMSANADTVAMTTQTYCAIGNNASIAPASAMLKVSEVYIGGESASTSTPAAIVVARHSTIAVTPTNNGTGVRQALTDATASAPVSTNVLNSFATAGTQPQRSATAHLLHLSFNAYGGIVRWVASPDQSITLATVTQPLAELSISSLTAATAPVTSGHFLYEVV
jgi:hypothetical protein